MNEESNNTTLESQNHPILSIVYDNGKNMESPISTSINTNVFASQFDNFDINQLTLQVAKIFKISILSFQFYNVFQCVFTFRVIMKWVSEFLKLVPQI